MKPTISIIIPSYNSEKTILRCLKSIYDQKTNISYEVIAADSSKDNTPKLIRKHFPQVKLIHSKKRMYAGKARNTGIKVANGKIITCVDSDCVAADEDWINKVYEAQKKHDIVGVRISNGNPFNLFGWGMFLLEFSEFISKKSRTIPFLLSYNVSFKKNIFRKYGYYPEHEHLNEDLLFHARIKEKLFFAGNIVVKHINRTNPLLILRHCYKIGLGSGLARKQEKTLEGHFLFKYPFLIPLLLPYRFLRAGYRCITAGYFLVFLLASPLIFINLIPYTAGFLMAAFKN
jgi:glycosyltransferase involved in cell wall biosynthesis